MRLTATMRLIWMHLKQLGNLCWIEILPHNPERHFCRDHLSSLETHFGHAFSMPNQKGFQWQKRSNATRPGGHYVKIASHRKPWASRPMGTRKSSNVPRVGWAIL